MDSNKSSIERLIEKSDVKQMTVRELDNARKKINLVIKNNKFSEELAPMNIILGGC